MVCSLKLAGNFIMPGAKVTGVPPPPIPIAIGTGSGMTGRSNKPGDLSSQGKSSAAMYWGLGTGCQALECSELNKREAFTSPGAA